MNLIPVSALPKIGWFGVEPLSRGRFEPIGPVPLEIMAGYTKPTGGLWCAPAARAGRHRQIIGTDWTTREGGDYPFTLVKPHRNTRVAVIDSRADLSAIIARFPDTRAGRYADPVPAGCHRDIWGRLRQGVRPPNRVDWPALAAEVDAVFLTINGVRQLNLPHDEPHLWGWDVPTILFLQPTFSPGRTITPPDPAAVRALHIDKFRRDMTALVRRGKLTTEQAEEAQEFFEKLLSADDE